MRERERNMTSTNGLRKEFGLDLDSASETLLAVEGVQYIDRFMAFV